MLTSLIEITFSDTHCVDREAGVIRGVRVLGRSSRNGREYSERALNEAAKLYQGIGVNLNHADRRDTTLERPLERAVEAGFGWLEAVEVRPDGVYGDLHFFKSHPQAAIIVEAAERNPRRFGLSHHAEGRVVRKGETNVVESIERVRSVDMVQNPATNAGLFESEEIPMHKTIRQILTETHGGRLAALLQDPLLDPYLVEGGGLATLADASLDLPADAGEDDQVASAFKSMIDAVLDDDSLDLKSRLAKIRDILKAQEKLTGGAAAPDSQAPPVSESVRPAASADPFVRQLVERLDRVESEAACRTLLEARNRACDATRLKTLALLTSEDERVRLIESWPERAGSHVSGLHPRPSVSRPLVESESVPLPKDAKALAMALR